MKKILLTMVLSVALLSGCITTGTRSQRNIERELDRVIIPELSFLDADIDAVLRYLEQSSWTKDAEVGASGDGAIDWKTMDKPSPTITVNMKNVSLLTAIKVIGESVGVDYAITDDGVKFREVTIDPSTHVHVELSATKAQATTKE